MVFPTSQTNPDAFETLRGRAHGPMAPMAPMAPPSYPQKRTLLHQDLLQDATPNLCSFPCNHSVSWI